MKNLNYFAKKATTSGNQPLSARMFLKENNVNGFLSKQESVNYINSLDQKDALHLDRALNAASEGAYLNSQLKSSFDKLSGEPILWLRFEHAKQQFPVLRIPYHEEMHRFFREYQLGKITPSFDLDELMAESGIITEETNEEAPAA